ncbi:glycosyl hydrolase family 28-related protein [Priestia megaterium]|uniref:glycosyl hydrolase family 28-related protein n=1 Tax=Priestia megaterium TaxID=1404 RepID=UPI003CC6BCC2
MGLIDGKIVQDINGKSITTNLGNIDNLNTTAKSSVVDAVNEQVDKITGQTSKINILEKNFISVIQSPFNAKGDGTTDDQNAIVAAIDYALVNNKDLYFPDGTYVSSANIPNFHSVRKFGTGVIKRGSDLFYITPKATQTNKIYLSPSGSSNTFDGLSSSSPIRELQTAVNILPNYTNPSLYGNWQFMMSSGVYAKKAEIPAGLGQRDMQIQIIGADVGGHPNIPTTIINQGAGASAVGLQATDGTRIYVKDIWFQDFNGTSSSAGISIMNYAKVTTNNVHAKNCFYGVSGIKHSMIIVPNGIFDNCGRLPDGSGTGAAFRSLQQNNHSIGIQDIGDRSKTVIIKNCRYGLWAQESSTGHCDWANIMDCEDGVVVRINSRVNVSGTEFKRNKRAIRTDSLAHVYIPSSVIFAVGTINSSTGRGADENENTLIVQSSSDVTSADIIIGQEMSASVNERWFGVDLIQKDISTTSATKFKTLTLKAPMWRYTKNNLAPSKKIIVRIKGAIYGTTNYKKINVRLGNTVTGLTFQASDSGTFFAEAEIEFINFNQQLIFVKGNSHLGGNRIGMVYASNDMLSNVDLTLEAQVTSSNDVVRIETCQVGWAG